MASLVVTIALTGVMFVTMPKGFFPQQDTGSVQISTEGAQDISFPNMMRKQYEAMQIVAADPAVDHFSSYIGSMGGSGNTGSIGIQLKPWSQRDVTADQLIERLRPKLDKLEGFESHMQSQQDITVGARQSRTQFQYTLQDQNLDELSHWSGGRHAREDERPAPTRGCRDRPAERRPAGDGEDRPHDGIPAGCSAAADRRHALARTRSGSASWARYTHSSTSIS